MAARVPFAKAVEWLEDLPPYYGVTTQNNAEGYEGDPIVLGLLNAMAGEYQRVDEAARALLVGGFPTHQPASEDLGVDTFRLLAFWENQLALPVEPPGVTVEQRRNTVLAHIRRRRASSEQEWYESLTEALGTTLWTYDFDGPAGIVTIHMPFAGTSLTAVQVYSIARKITPAHLDVQFAYDEGFILDYSPLDTGSF